MPWHKNIKTLRVKKHAEGKKWNREREIEMA